jgi:hypothetical protein
MSKQNQNYLYLTGEDGLYDTTFPSSPKGDRGSRGHDGVDGQKGEMGQKGRDGLAGYMTSIVGSFGTNTPDNLPKNGTFPVGWDDGVNPPVMFHVNAGETLIDRTTGYMWTLTPAATTTNWSQIGQVSPIKGETGLTGHAGDKGQRGDIGIDGTNGADGNDGSKGDVGPKGEVGSKGQKGQRGVDGINGGTGSTGQKGNAGVDGTNGTDGSRGDKGQKGETGLEGNKGEVGNPGVKGTKGDKAEDSLFPRSMVSFRGSNQEIFDSLNVLGVDRLGTGNYKVNFSKSLSNNRYTVIASANGGLMPTAAGRTVMVTTRLTNSVTVQVKNSSTGGVVDDDYVNLIVYKCSD